jgi:hypothetical protein
MDMGKDNKVVLRDERSNKRMENKGSTEERSERREIAGEASSPKTLSPLLSSKK